MTSLTTERASKTQELLASMPDLLLDQLATAIICLDDGLRLTYMNQSAESLFSTGFKHALGCHITDWAGTSPEMLKRLQQALKERQSFSDRQLTLSWPGRNDALVDCHVSLHHPESGTPGLLLEFTLVDRHLRIAREEALMAQQEHNRLFLRGLTHEIKNPLGGLRGAAQLLERELPDPSLTDYTRVIIREADRLQKLVDDMVGPVSRPNMVELNIHDPLEHVRKIISVETQGKVAIKTDYDPSIPEFRSDRDRLTQVFLNIAINAVYAVAANDDAPPGEITISTRVNNNFTLGGVRHPLVIATKIIDTGPGISAELLDQIFFPLVSARPGGTGLGLSIAQQTINQLGGLIECDSQPGNTVFTVLIPLELS